MTKQEEYSAKILAQLQGIFDSANENYISIDELSNSNDNSTSFIHALATIIPCYLYNKFTGENLALLDFNYLANSIIFLKATEHTIDNCCNSNADANINSDELKYTNDCCNCCNAAENEDTMCKSE